MNTVHAWIGVAVVAAYAVMFLWGLGAWFLRRGVGTPFWWVLTFIQVSLALQLIGGIVLFAVGGRPDWLHYAYGLVFPVGLLVAAHVLARDRRFTSRPWFPFAISSFFAFGLTLRALMTGWGLG
ncbi:MAG: hypothetical protein ACRDH6_04595 [Actinomycetota bacterium]